MWIDRIDAGDEKAGRTPRRIAVLLLLSVLCIVCRVEYSLCSVLLIPAFYYAGSKKRQLGMGALAFVLGSFLYLFFVHLLTSGTLAAAAACLVSACSTMRIELWGLLALLPIGLYDGSKGIRLPRYLFYAFYPVHLLVLGVIALALQG